MNKYLANHFLIASKLHRRKFYRRDVLGFIGGTVAVSLMKNGWGQTVAAAPAPPAPAPPAPAHSSLQTIATPACVVKPEQTEGPYFVDEKLNRSDLRSDPSDGSVKPGMPLQLVFQVAQVSNGICTPLSGAIVDVWHCDAEGVYSDVNEPRFNTVGKKFLRGYQVTDAQGIAQFITVYPGSYPGRAVHIHFKIRTNSASQQSSELQSSAFTSQLYFDDALTDQIYEQPPYTAGTRTLNHQDGIFQRGGEQLMLQLTPAATGYSGNFAIGLV